MSPLVSSQWLLENLNHPDLVILDSTFLSPVHPQKLNHSDLQIPQTQIFDFDKEICDQNSALPHMMPNSKDFELQVRKLGISKTSLIVIYDRIGVFSSPRAWWMFQAMGHKKTFVLNGGFPDWVSQNFPCEKLQIRKKDLGNFVSEPQTSFFCDAQFVENHLQDTNILILDARSKERFLGTVLEPRKGIRSGHIPNSKNLPFDEVLQDGKFLPQNLLEEKLKPILKEKKQTIFSCGSGVTACILALAAHIAKFKNLSVYDGSWSEWGQENSNFPVVK